MTFRSASMVCLLAFASTRAFAASSPDDLTARMLLAHNRERAAVGVAPLVWDPALATAAASYASVIAQDGRLVHSPRESRLGQRENLAMGWTATTSPEQLVGVWAQEKRYFRSGKFPDVSSTGNWNDVSHYTQLIWRTTTKLGCGTAFAEGWTYLVCRYSPPGNVDGRPVP